MNFHFVLCGCFPQWIVICIVHYFFGSNGGYLFPNKQSFKEAGQVLLHDLHIRKYHPPQDKIQCRAAYCLYEYYHHGHWSFITGFAMYKPVQLNWPVALCGGYEAARMEHFILTIGYVLFFLIHIAASD